MKLKLTLITGAIAASSLCLHAEVPRAGGPLPPVVVYGPASASPQANGHVYRTESSFTELIGVEVWNLQNEKLGRIKYITADFDQARLVDVAIVSGGGWFGLGGKITSVPPRSLRLDATSNLLRLDMSKALFDAEPAFRTTRQANIQKISSIIDLPIHNPQGQYLGKVGSLMMDLPSGRIVQVINVTQAMGGEGNSVLAPRALRFNAKHSSLVLNQSPAQLDDQPLFKWVGGTRPSFKEEFNHAAVPPSARAPQTRQGTRAAIAMAQGQPARDAQKTSRIEHAIKTQSTQGGEVNVVTLNCQTTLRGHVSTAAGKRQIGEIAAQAGQSGKVTNLLVVRAPTGRASS